MRKGVHISVTLLLIYPPSSKLTNYLDNIFNKHSGTACSVHQVVRTEEVNVRRNGPCPRLV